MEEELTRTSCITIWTRNKPENIPTWLLLEICKYLTGYGQISINWELEKRFTND